MFKETSFFFDWYVPKVINKKKVSYINRQLKNRTNFKDREGFGNETNIKDENFKDFLRNLNFYQSLKKIEKKFFRTGKSKRDRENK